MGERLRVGVIGTGWAGTEHLIRLLGLRSVEVVGLCDSSAPQLMSLGVRVGRRLSNLEDAEPGAEWGRMFAESGKYSDAETLLAEERLDAVYICVPPSNHGPAELLAAKKGIPLFIEKPVAMALPLAKVTADEIDKSGVLNATGYQGRYSPLVRRARQILENNEVAMAVCNRFSRTPRTEWFRVKERSGGQMVEMATHQVDLMRYLVGEIDSVYAKAALRVNHRRWVDFDIFDTACSVVTFASGALGSIAMNLIPNSGPPTFARGIHFFCADVTISLLLREADGDSMLEVVRPDGVERLTTEQDSMQLQDERFCQAVRDGRQDLILSDYANAYQTLAVTLAHEQSLLTGGQVRIEEYIISQGG